MVSSRSEGTEATEIPAFAHAGTWGYARATRAAIAGYYGRAELVDTGGVALVGESGRAEGREYAILAGSGPNAMLQCGDRGIAFAADTSRELTVGDEGIVIAMKPAERVTTGKHSIVVLMDADTRGPIVTVGEGSLIIKRFDGKFVVAMPGEVGLIENAPCLSDGAEFLDAGTNPYVFENYLRELNISEYVHLERFMLESLGLSEISGEVSDNSAAEPAPASAPTAERIDPLTHDRKIILCKRSPDGAIVGDDYVVALQWDPDPTSLDGVFGLLWGIGDPAAVGLGYGERWVLVEVDSYVPTSPADHLGHPGAIKFRDGVILQTGSYFEILEKLIELGVEPDRLIGRVQRVGDGGRAEAGRFGAAIAGARGWASADRSGAAVVGENGFAEAGTYGFANAGYRGIAITDADGSSFARVGGVAVSRGKRYGYAGVAGRGLAVGDGRFKRLVAGSRGAAVSTGSGSNIRTMSDAVAIGRGDLQLRSDCVGVAMDGTLSGTTGALLVGCYHDAVGQRRYAVAMVGRDGILPDTRYGVREGCLTPVDE